MDLSASKVSFRFVTSLCLYITVNLLIFIVNNAGNVKSVQVEADQLPASFWDAFPAFLVTVRGTHVDYVPDKNNLDVSIKFKLGDEFIDEHCKFCIILIFVYV